MYGAALQHLLNLGGLRRAEISAKHRSSVPAELLGHHIGISGLEQCEDGLVARRNHRSNFMDEVFRDAGVVLPRLSI